MRKPLRSLLLLALISAVSSSAATLRAVFDPARETSEFKWTLKEVDPQLPADWTGYQFLVVEMRASSPQRFRFFIHAAEGPAGVRLHLYQGAWVRAALPLAAFQQRSMEGHDMASIGNRSHAGYYLNLSGPLRPLRPVEAIGVSMQTPLGNPVLEIRSVRLANESPGDAVLEPLPLVDEFGQWMPADWPGKARNLEQLRKDWAKEAESLGAADFGYCAYGGYKDTKAKATGFFRVEQAGGKWWFVDPDGHLFFSTGADVTTPRMGGPAADRKSVFAALPPADLVPAGGRGGGGGGASFFTWNIARRFGPDWREKWVDFTIRRMNAWGMNTVGNWSDPSLFDSHRIAYTVSLGGWSTKVSYIGMPDVYSEEFARNCDQAAARQCAPRARDPFLLGYFTANEPPWPGREAGLVEMILSGPDTAIRRELQKYLSAQDTPERRRAFVYRAYEKYLEVVVGAIRKHDPNHLNLGMRFAGNAPDEMVKASRVFDVFSLNIYEDVPRPEVLERAYQLTGRPLLIGEFHFGTPGRGLSAGLRQVRDGRERGVAYRYYVENAAAMPAFIGAHWFQWMDEPATGRGDGENYNIGLVDVTDRPYADFLEGVKATHLALRAVHSGAQKPVIQKAAAN